MPDLPVNIDATYPDDAERPDRKLHQQHHDALHERYNEENAAETLPAAKPFTTTTMDDEIVGGTMTVVVMPESDAVLAIAQEGDAFPRVVITSDPSGFGIALGDGTTVLEDMASILYGPYGMVLQGGATADPSPIGLTDPAVLITHPATFHDLHFIIASRGPVLRDRSTGDWYRLFVDGGGVLSIEAV